MEIASIYDMNRKGTGKICFIEAIEAMEKAKTAKELMALAETYDLKMNRLYQGSEFKRRELGIWLNMLARRLKDNSTRFSKKHGKGGK
jgi:hypothetical protein